MADTAGLSLVCQHGMLVGQRWQPATRVHCPVSADEGACLAADLCSFLPVAVLLEARAVSERVSNLLLPVGVLGVPAIPVPWAVESRSIATQGLRTTHGRNAHSEFGTPALGLHNAVA